jgi:protein CpxP
MNMKSILKPVLVAALLAAAGFSTFASGNHGRDEGGMMGHGMYEGQGRMGQMNPEKMQARMDKRNAELKAELKITAAQEGAWTAFTNAMKPPAGKIGQRPDQAELAKLTTPERIDKMKALRAEYHATMNTAMDQRADATKAFYAVLTPEQKKVFDDKGMRQDHARGGMQGQRDGKGGMMQPKKDAS